MKRLKRLALLRDQRAKRSELEAELEKLGGLEEAKEKLEESTGELEAVLEELDEASEDFEAKQADFDKALEELTQQQEENATAIQTAQEVVDGLKGELDALAEELEALDKGEPEAEEADGEGQRNRATPKKRNRSGAAVYTPGQNRGDSKMEKMITRGAFKGYTQADCHALLQRQDVQNFVKAARDAATKRAITGDTFFIPEPIVDLLNENTERYSKLRGFFKIYKIRGRARVQIVAEYPTAVWSEAAEALTELDFKFNLLDLDGYKVGGYVFIPKSTVEDTDQAFIEAIIDGLAASIAKAQDMAFLYGDGKKKPLGIVARLMQEAKPDSWSATAPEWEDLHTAHAIKLDGKGGLIKQMVEKAGILKNENATGLFWAMNTATYHKLLADSLSYTANGAYVSAVKDELPVLGGRVVVLDFIPDGEIVGGYGSGYVVVDRYEYDFATTDQVKWIEEQIGYKATQRLDGTVADPKCFAVFYTEAEAPKPDKVKIPTKED